LKPASSLRRGEVNDDDVRILASGDRRRPGVRHHCLARRSITFDQAVRRAANRPAVAIAGTEVDAVRAEAAGARRPIYNPELGVAIGPRFGGGQTLLDAEVSLAQTIELGGKRDARRAVADARVAAAGSNLVQAQLDAEFEVWRAFQLTLLARARIDATREAEALATQLVTASSDRQALGAGTQLQINLATLEGGRARHDRLDAENAYDAALAELARVIGAAPDERLEPVGELATLPAAALDEDALVARALANRPDLDVARAGLRVARAEVRLANAEATPNLTASVSYGYEQDLDTDFHAVMAGLSISLPVRNRNQGARSAARARVRGAELEQDRRTVDVEREVRVAIRAYARARKRCSGSIARSTNASTTTSSWPTSRSSPASSTTSNSAWCVATWSRTASRSSTRPTKRWTRGRRCNAPSERVGDERHPRSMTTIAALATLLLAACGGGKAASKDEHGEKDEHGARRGRTRRAKANTTSTVTRAPA
jgi:cobalt-zinc-cadmium efflux system outer membrane protein